MPDLAYDPGAEQQLTDPAAAGLLFAPGYDINGPIATPPPPPTATATYPTGPTSQPSPYTGIPTVSSPAPDLYAGIPGAVLTWAQNLVDTFGGYIGWPSGYDSAKAIADLSKQGYLSNMDAYNWLFNSGYMTDAQRSSMPWAQFGMDKDTYATTSQRIKGAYFDILGGQMPADVLARALREAWSATDIQNYLEFGDPTGHPSQGSAAPVYQDAPWVSEGGTYKQALEQYQAAVGKAPDNVHTLAGWWRFGQASKVLSTAAPAETFSGPLSFMTPAKQATDVQTR